MFLARNEVISNPCHWHDFPPPPRTLWELTHVATSVFKAMSNSLIRELSILYLVAIILMLQSGMEPTLLMRHR